MRLLPRPLLTLSGALAGMACLALAAPSWAQPSASSFGRLSYVERTVEQATGTGGWREATEGGAFEIGERLRTGPQALARLELPWMSLSLSPG